MNDFIQQGLPHILFLAFCVLAIGSSVAVVTLRNPVSAAFSLILVLLNVAGIFAMQEAYFVAAVQILVYAGAIMVLFIFVIMLLSIEHVDHDMPDSKMFWGVPIGLGLVFFLGMGFVLIKGTNASAKGPFTTQAIEAAGGNVRVISEVMFSDYILPFLSMGMLLSICIVGAVLLAKRRVD
ncbi:MAG: NADH-quinone oxidoreductase subunit J family protein [Bdellovibrionota bacterium]